MIYMFMFILKYLSSNRSYVYVFLWLYFGKKITMNGNIGHRETQIMRDDNESFSLFENEK